MALACLSATLLGCSTANASFDTTSGRGSKAKPRTAAATYHWGKAAWSDGFTGRKLTRDWAVYDSPGHAGNGRRLPEQVTLHNGVLTQSGKANADTGGMVVDHHSHAYGRWETRIRNTTNGRGHRWHSVTALIPGDGAAYHCGAHDIDFAEYDIGQPVQFYAHQLPTRQDYTRHKLDSSTWHTFAVEITKTHMSWFVDGRVVMTDTDKKIVSGVPLAPNFQLDANYKSGFAPGTLKVDWIRYYPLRGKAAPLKAPEPNKNGVYDGAC